MEDIHLIHQIQKNPTESSDAILELYSRHSGICYEASQKYIPALSKTGVAFSDIESHFTNLVYDAAANFNPDKNSKFSTWLYNQTRYYCLNTLNRHGAAGDEELEDLGCDTFEELFAFGTEKIELIKSYLDKLEDTRVKYIFDKRYFDNREFGRAHRWKDIAAHLDLSVQNCIRLHNNALEKIRGFLV